MSILIIGEAGVNHNGSLDLARRLVDAGADAGVDVVKFQTFRASALVTRAARKADYQQRNEGGDETQHDMLRRLELAPDMHAELRDHCLVRRVEFMSTGFDEESLALLERVGVQRLKIPSGEITNLPYLRLVGSMGKPIILSTGMATLGEIECALDVLEAAGSSRNGIIVLHCTTEYPAPLADVNLRAMLTIRDAFGVQVGYSDHTEGIEVPIAAAALGACVIEKHFTLDRTLPGPDHRASLEPEELAEMVAAIRNVETALGNGIKRLAPSEEKNRDVARRSIVAKRDIEAGEVLSEANLTVKRPGTGISPMRWDEVVGRRAARPFLADEPLEI